MIKQSIENTILEVREERRHIYKTKSENHKQNPRSVFLPSYHAIYLHGRPRGLSMPDEHHSRRIQLLACLLPQSMHASHLRITTPLCHMRSLSRTPSLIALPVEEAPWGWKKTQGRWDWSDRRTVVIGYEGRCCGTLEIGVRLAVGIVRRVMLEFVGSRYFWHTNWNKYYLVAGVCRTRDACWRAFRVFLKRGDAGVDGSFLVDFVRWKFPGLGLGSLFGLLPFRLLGNTLFQQLETL